METEARGTPEPLAERISWDEQQKSIDATKTPINETYTEF